MKPTVLFYVQHLLGIGHLRRAALIARPKAISAHRASESALAENKVDSHCDCGIGDKASLFGGYVELHQVTGA